MRDLYGNSLFSFYAERVSNFYLKKQGYVKFPTRKFEILCGKEQLKSPDFIKIEEDFISGVEVKSLTGGYNSLRKSIREAAEQLRYCDYRIVHIHTWDDYLGERSSIGRFSSIDKVIVFRDGQYQRTILGNGKERKWKIY